uniref:Peptidyl-prolyl cis-trans isomerase n=1 Tax=Rhabditophanes sp. KR3021 TaxID=114890 RepID=A0AC35TK54_9BILA
MSGEEPHSKKSKSGNEDAPKNSSPLPKNWEYRHSSSRGVGYYINKQTGQSQWEKPTSENIKRDEIRCAHLLVKHVGSRNPSSWRSEKITRTKEDAINILTNYKKEIESSDNIESTFGRLAETCSDCSSAKKRGDLGMFGKGQMQKAFENVAFSLKIGEMSNIVDSDSGVHLIYRLH